MFCSFKIVYSYLISQLKFVSFIFVYYAQLILLYLPKLTFTDNEDNKYGSL